MSLISMSEEENKRYKELIKAAKKAEETGKRQKFPCVGLKGVTLEIDNKRNVYNKGKFVMTYSSEVLQEIPKNH